MPLVDAVNRVAQIQAQIASLAGVPPVTPAPPVAPVVGGAPVPLASAAAPTAVASTPFATVLAQAQGLALSPRAQELLTPGQRTFVAELARETGLDQRVVAAWCLAEQSSTAADAREAAGNHNWLNIGYTDSGTYGADAPVWRDPVSAARATAGWLRGEDAVAGYGRASAGVQAILHAAGLPPEAQVAALQRSGWASSGYPDLPVLLRQVSG
jgi:hypothetical protein